MPAKVEVVEATAAAETVVTGEQQLVGPKPAVVAHITHSIYLKHIHPRISADDVIEVSFVFLCVCVCCATIHHH